MKTNKKRKKHHNHNGERKCSFQYLSIDGNWTWFPCAVCHYYGGVLTKGQMKTHRCKERHCRRLQEGVNFE